MSGMVMLAEASTPTTGDMSLVVNAMGTVVQVVGKVWDVIVGNPFLLFSLGAGALVIGTHVFRSVKNSAH